MESLHKGTEPIHENLYSTAAHPPPEPAVALLASARSPGAGPADTESAHRIALQGSRGVLELAP